MEHEVEEVEEAVVEGEVEVQDEVEEVRKKWKKGNTVWVWDEAPADDDGEGDMTWDVFKGKIDLVKFTAVKKDGEYEIQFGKERFWYSDDQMFPTQSATLL